MKNGKTTICLEGQGTLATGHGIRIYMPKIKGIKVEVNRFRVNRKIKKIEPSIQMFNILEVNTYNLDCRILSMTGNVMKYNTTGRFKIERTYYDRVVLNKDKFSEKRLDIFIDL